MTKPDAEAAGARRKRSTRREMALRDARLVRLLAAGATIEEVAAREDITPRRARERISEILARRAADPPGEFVQLQIRRLSEAMTVAYGAMSNGNLKAVDRVINIIREFDRYHGFALSLAAVPAALAPPFQTPALPPPAPSLAAAAPTPMDPPTPETVSPD
jgi:DNA-binding CsgD family transcriptional regulator